MSSVFLASLLQGRQGFLAALLMLVVSGAAASADRPQWGEHLTRNMVSAEKGLPDSFDPRFGSNVLWTAKLGTHSYSTPVIARGKVLLGTNNDVPRDPRHRGDRGVLLCLDEKDGSLVWQLVVPKIAEDRFSDWPSTGIASSPTVDGERVYVVTNRGEVACLDLDGLADGNDGPYRDEGRHMAPADQPAMEPGPTDADIIWLFDAVKELGIHQHDAAHCSPLVLGGHVYACTSNGVDAQHLSVVAPEAPSFFALDKETGRLAARDGERIGPRTIHCTWSSASSGVVGGKPLVFFGGGDGVCYAFAALETTPPAGAAGKLQKVWSFDCDPGAPKEDIFKFQDNRKEGPSNITGMPVFHQGRVYVTAGGDLWHGKLQAWLKCIDATKTGDITKSGEVWSYPLERHCMSTPAIAGDLVFIADCGRKIHCLDAATGRPHWTHQAKGEIWGSPLVADGKVFAGSQRGDFWILAAAREKQVLGSVDLDHAVNASPSAAAGVLYVATMEHLYALRRR
jgi:outer membrane protein assembly factor BamB